MYHAFFANLPSKESTLIEIYLKNLNRIFKIQ